MPYVRERWRQCAVLALVCLPIGLAPGEAAAQGRTSLRAPTIAASVAAAADWASTYHALKYYELRETNPLLQSFQGTPARLVTFGAAIDAAAFSTWNVTVGRKHPRIAAAGLWAMAGFRAYLAFHNLRNETKVARRNR